MIEENNENVKLALADKIFIFGVFTLSASIPVSKFTTSVSIFIMVLAWLLKWNWQEKLDLIKNNRFSFLLSTSLFYVFVIGFFYSSDTGYALKDLKIKLPLFALPVLFATSRQLTVLQVKIALALICASAITASLIGFIQYNIYIGTPKEFTDLRQMSPFISHIRLTLILCFAVAYALWFISKTKSVLKSILIIPIIWICFFIGSMGSLTGTAILPLVLLLFLIVFLYKKNKTITILGTLLITLVGVVSIIHVAKIYDLVFTPKTIVQAQTKTINGNLYQNDKSRLDAENGYRTWDYVCESELEKEWEKQSQIPYQGELNGFPFKDVIIRYLTSKGEKKDSAAVSRLQPIDIAAIEKGVANEFYVHNNKLSNRIHVTFWELKNLQKNGYANGSSITMRFEYWKIALGIFSENWLLGVGTGDIQNEFQNAYANQGTNLDKRYQRRSHNQYLTILATLGILGLILFLIAFIYPLMKYKGELQFLFLVFGIIILVSMLWEDTIESQAGVTIFALLNSLFLFSKRVSE